MLALGAACMTRARKAPRSSAVPGCTRAMIMRGTGRSSIDSPVPSQGSSSLPLSSLLNGLTSTMPACARMASVTAAVSRSRSRPVCGRTWMVISLATSDCHSAAEALTSSTVPVVIDARKVMMATTATSARPWIEARGTIGDMLRALAGSGGPSCPRSTSTPRSSGLFIDVQPSLVQHEASRLVLVHQGDVVGGDDDGGAGLVELDEQPQQAAAERRIDAPGRLVGQQQLRPRDHGARDRRALLLAPGQDRRQRIHALAEPDPFQEVDDLLAVARFAAAHDAERQRDVLIGGHVVEQAEILEHDADALAQVCDLVLAKLRDVVTEQIDEAARRAMREEQQAQQRGLAGAGRAGEKLERMRRDLEVEVAQDLGPQAVTQSDIFEPNQAQLRSREAAGRTAVLRHTRSTGFAAVMVSGSLTVVL